MNARTDWNGLKAPNTNVDFCCAVENPQDDTDQEHVREEGGWVIKTKVCNTCVVMISVFPPRFWQFQAIAVSSNSLHWVLRPAPVTGVDVAKPNSGR